MIRNLSINSNMHRMKILRPGEGDSHMKLTGMLVGKLELNPKGDQSGRGSGVI